MYMARIPPPDGARKLKYLHISPSFLLAASTLRTLFLSFCCGAIITSFTSSSSSSSFSPSSNRKARNKLFATSGVRAAGKGRGREDLKIRLGFCVKKMQSLLQREAKLEGKHGVKRQNTCQTAMSRAAPPDIANSI